MAERRYLVPLCLACWAMAAGAFWLLLMGG